MEWTSDRIHLAYLGCEALAAALALALTLLSVARRGDGGRFFAAVLRIGASALACGSATVLLLAFAGMPAAERAGHGFALAFGATVLAAVLAVLIISFTSFSARAGLLAATTFALSSIGVIVYLVLIGAAPGSDAWEIRHAADFLALLSMGWLIVLAAGFRSSRRHGWAVVAAYLAGAAALVTAAVLCLRFAPGAGGKLYLGLVLAGGAAYLWRAHRPWRSPLSDEVRLWLVAALPPALAFLGYALGTSGGSARDAMRATVFGVSFSPSLLVPFALAPALGACLRVRRLWPMFAVVAATLAALVAQKELGVSAVVLGMTAVTVLVSRGNVVGVSLAAAGLLTLALVAYQLAPVLEFVPFTLRERVFMWMGGADLLHRGGHLVAADHLALDLGGFFGVGQGHQVGLNLPRLVASIHTDFPLAVVGFYGGAILLCAYLGLFLALGVLLFDALRRQRYAGDETRSRQRLPLLAGLAAALVISTLVNVAGALVRATPFTGLPAMLASYGAVYLLGTFVTVAAFIVVLSRAAQGSPAPVVAPEPAGPRVAIPHGRHGLALLLRRMGQKLAFRSVGGAVLATQASLAMAVTLLGARMVDRYADPAAYHAHPRLETRITVEPGEVGNRWSVTRGPDAWLGTLETSKRYRVDDLLFRYRPGALQLVGSCFAQERLDAGVRIGFRGMLDAPRFAVADELTGRIDGEGRNDVVLPFGDVYLSHLLVRREQDGFTISPLTPGATFRRLDEHGQPTGDPLSAPAHFMYGDGFGVGARRFVLALRDGETCLEAAGPPLFSYDLSPVGPTVLGGLEVLRNRRGRVTTDFEFAEKVKAACEAGVITFEGGRLGVIPHAAADRATWSAKTKKLFLDVFEVTADGAVRWKRGFYDDGGRAFKPDAEIDAFVIDGSRVLGLADSFRFMRRLPTGKPPLNRLQHGVLRDRLGHPLIAIREDGRAVRNLAPEMAPLVGYLFPERGMAGGLLRSFRELLAGGPAVPDPAAELEKRWEGRPTEPWGYDVELTLDAEVARLVHRVLAAELAKLDKKDPGIVHRGQAVVLGPRNEIVAAVSLPSWDPNDVDKVTAEKDRERLHPNDARGLETFHGGRCVGSTAKVAMATAALAEAERTLIMERGEVYFRADGEPHYAKKGRYFGRGSTLRSFRGQRITTVSNFGGEDGSGAITLRKMLQHSINTAAAYLGLIVGKEAYLTFLDRHGFQSPRDLLPVELGAESRLGHLVERFPYDPLTLAPPRVARIPDGERWNDSYTARLALSGFSDYPMVDLALLFSIAARGGELWPPVLVRSFTDKGTNQKTVPKALAPERVISARQATYLRRAMMDVVARGTAGSLRRTVPPALWKDMGGKTGTGETTTKIEPGKGKGGTKDNKVFAGFWPASAPEPYVVATFFEEASHLDFRVAIRAFGKIVQGISEIELRRVPTVGQWSGEGVP